MSRFLVAVGAALVCLPLLAQTVPEPAPPREPVEPTVDADIVEPTVEAPGVDAPSAQSDATQPTRTYYAYRARVTRADGATFEGTGYFPIRALRNMRTVGGQSFSQEIPLESIDLLLIRDWMPQNRQSNASQGQSGQYTFNPASFELFLKDGTRLLYTDPIPALSRFTFETDLGKTNFYGYFVDEWVSQSDVSFWKISRSTEFSGNVRVPHGMAVLGIQFFGIQASEVQLP